MESQWLRVLDTARLLPHAPAPLPLSVLDADRNMLDVTFRTLRFFPPPPPPVDPFAVLTRAFAAALGLFPALASRVVLAASVLSAADVDTDSPGSALLDCLAPGDGNGGSGADGLALALQATRFACGGVALGMRVAHALCDGVSATKFLAAAARFAHGMGPPDVAPVWERRELLGPRQPSRVATPVFDRVLELARGVLGHGADKRSRRWRRRLGRECAPGHAPGLG
ncbi:hypothetical protein SEVIR_6G088000v4 [Setaria viridis]|uniref:Uncharacterized protein n=1 Tax=Setaria viridis TaxID=4556 RepID=A0A4U6U6K0_SETVI|nr:hypothetical protein SEVIR_6G088000v2 [Setaria viridis]